MHRNRNQLSPGFTTGQTRSAGGLLEILLSIALLSIAIVAILTAFLLPSIRRGPAPAHRAQCKNNLKQIGLALHNYHETHGAFPPACTVDANGTPLHSWRTLILPFLDQQPLFEKIGRSKPWNDPANAEAYATPVPAFVCPSTDIPAGHTTYQALVGPDCAFRPGQPRQIRDFKDGTSNSVLVVDASPSIAVHWMDPSDSARSFFLSFDEESEFPHSSGCHVLLGDGSVKFISGAVPKKTRTALSDIADGEAIDPF
mgnify:CR=1 FL=1